MEIDYDITSLNSLKTYLLFGEINEDQSYKVADFIIKSNLLSTNKDPLNIVINSDGGNTSDGWLIIDLIKNSKLSVHALALGEIASMATMIFVACNTRVMTSNTLVMTHQFSSYMEGKSHELMAVRGIHDHLDKMFIHHLTKHTNLNKTQVKDILLGPTDKWLTSKECLKYGICDYIK